MRCIIWLTNCKILKYKRLPGIVLRGINTHWTWVDNSKTKVQSWFLSYLLLYILLTTACQSNNMLSWQSMKTGDHYVIEDRVPSKSAFSFYLRVKNNKNIWMIKSVFWFIDLKVTNTYWPLAPVNSTALSGIPYKSDSHSMSYNVAVFAFPKIKTD